MSVWQRWLQHPESLWARKSFFYFHLSLGTIVGLYVLFMSISGSLIVFRNQLSGRLPIDRVVNLHENLSLGETGRLINGFGAACVLLLCFTGAVIWWPGIADWRRALTVKWRSHWGRLSWDLHSALGFWFFLFVLIWGVSGFYFVFPGPFNGAFEVLDPRDRFTDQTLLWLSELHFGRFNLFSEALWAVLGLVPGVLAFTGVFLCCRRLVHGFPQHKGGSPEK